jgi:oligogalacturonide lyase
MRLLALILFVAAAGTGLQTPAPAGRRDWVDPATGHRVIRISDDPGSSTLYFHDNAFSAAGDRMMLRTPKGVAVVEVARFGVEDPKLDLVAPQAGGGYFARRGRDIYLSAGAGNSGSGRSAGSVKAVNIDTRVVREVANATGLINADETLSVIKRSPAIDRDGKYPPPPPRPILPQLQRMFPGKRMEDLTADQQYAVKKEDQLAARALNPGLQSLVFTKLASGESYETGFQYGDLNHLQFNPVDPGMLLYCHEGTWHELDRTWTIRADGSAKRLMHKRTMDMEINGHEWWSWDGKTVWFDLQTPRSQVFWLAGVNLETGRQTRYHVERDWWGIHFNSSRDDTLFASDGGDPSQVAYSSDGMWINLFRVQPDGTLSRERLVDMSSHNYVTGRGGVEPNVHITPDKKWVVFTGQFAPAPRQAQGPSEPGRGSGERHVYAVEIARQK